MKRILLAVLVVALVSTAVVTIAFAATNYVLAPSRAASLDQPAVQSHSAVFTDDIRPANWNNREASSEDQQGNCPFHSTSTATDSSPSY